MELLYIAMSTRYYYKKLSSELLGHRAEALWLDGSQSHQRYFVRHK